MRFSSRRKHLAVLASLAVLALGASACGSRLDAAQQKLAQGASSNGAANGGSPSGVQESSNGVTTTTECTSTTPSSTTTTTTSTTAVSKSTTTTKATTSTTKASAATTTTTTAPCTSSTTPGGGSLAAGPTGTGGGGTGGGTGTGTGTGSGSGSGGGGAVSGVCGADGNETPAAGNGGATDTGVTATTITVGNIASISGVVPGLTQSAQQATQAWAAFVNSQGGICGRQIKVQPFDDGSDSGQNFADTQQACSSDFAMVGNSSGFDDGSAQADNSCGMPIMAGEVSTEAAGAAPDIFGASPGDGHNFQLGPANYLKSQYPNAIQHAAMIYLNVPATQDNALHEVAAYQSVGFKYVYNTSTTPTNANYAANVQAMQSAGVQYVTEYSDASSAERLLQSMQQANFTPQVVDWFSEEYSPQFAQQTAPFSNGDLVLMSATDAYEEASSNPEMTLFLQWLNRVAPGAHHDIFGVLAWSAGLAFEQAAKAVGPHLTRAALIAQLKTLTNWTGNGIQPAVNIGGKVPSKCFAYFKIENGAFQRVYPAQANTFDCNSPLFSY